MSKKVEDQELASLKEKVSLINNLQLQIGGLEASKHELLHNISAASTDLAVFQKELEEKYGQVSVSIATGEIVENEPSKED
jgi:hypothetical protein